MRDPHRTTIIEGNCPDPEYKTVLVTELCGYYTRHLYGFFIFFFPLPRDLILNKTTTKRKISSRLPYLISRALILFFFFFYTHRGYVSYVRILLLYTSYFSINDTLVSFKKKKKPSYNDSQTKRLPCVLLLCNKKYRAMGFHRPEKIYAPPYTAECVVDEEYFAFFFRFVKI